MAEATWIKHPSGILYRRGRKNGELLYQIQGADKWIDEKDFCRRCEVNTRETPRDHRRHESDYRNLVRVSASAEAADHQGPLRGPGPLDSRLFPAEGDLQESQSQEPRTGQNYEVRPRDGRMDPEDLASARRGSAYHNGYRSTSTLVSRTRSAGTEVVSPSMPRVLDSADLSERPLPAHSSHLSSLARSFLGLGLGNYLECSHFISENPTIIAKSEIDALIAEATVAEKAGQSTRAQTCIHQALLLKQCKEVGWQKIGSFFGDLTSKDGRTKDAFVKDVKKVYISIQQHAVRASQPNQRPTSESQDRKAPVVLQAIERTMSQSSYTDSQETEETTHSQTPVVRGRDGRLYYADAQGNTLHPASRRHGPDRHRSQSDPIEPSVNMPAVSEEHPSQNGERRRDERHAPGRTGSFHRPAASVPPGPLPTVPEHRKFESTRIGGTKGDVEKLDDRYRVRKDAKNFFERGRVFALLWHESAGGGGGAGGQRIHTELSDPVAVRGRFGEEVYSHIRRMVVVKAEHGFCLCLPINTYNGQGVTKPGLSEGDRQAHSIAHMTDTRPYCLPEEESDLLINKSIAVEKASPDQKLDPMSRLNFKKIYTIEHNVKVMSVGKVTRDSLPVVLGYWRKALE